MKRPLVVLLLALVSVHGLKELTKKCPKVIAKNPFDSSKYFGRWYVVAGLPYSVEDTASAECVMYDVTKASDSSPIHTTLKYTMNNTVYTEQMYSRLVPTGGATVYIIADQGGGNWGDIYKESIVATDYEQYAVLIGCQLIFDPVSKQFGRQLYADIASRTTSLDEKVLDTLKNFISSYDIEATKIIKGDFSNCNID
ncbi:hypothetical protein B566_EDAN007014 [Ephemera danica]|nr:hypothetical protein B566_EDAN007014 [Ephemera danica]